MVEYSYWEKYVGKFQKTFGSKLEIDNCSLNISAEYYRNVPIISFGNILMPTQYLDLLNGHCNWILSNQNIFHGIGNYENEDVLQKNFEEIDYNLSAEDFRINYFSPRFCNKLPFDDRRRKIAAMLRDLVTYFAIYHELGHARQNSYKKSSEISYGQNKSVMWDKQAMEVDADMFGINWLWRLVFNNFHTFTSNETFKTKIEVLEICLYSTLLFFELSSNSKILSDPFNTHPNPTVRFKILSAFIENIVVKNFLTKEEFYQTTETVLKEFDKTRVYHFGESDPHDYYNKSKSTEMIAVISVLENYLKADLSLNCNRPYSVK